jgi:hypothetical protein
MESGKAGTGAGYSGAPRWGDVTEGCRDDPGRQPSLDRYQPRCEPDEEGRRRLADSLKARDQL